DAGSTGVAMCRPSRAVPMPSPPAVVSPGSPLTGCRGPMGTRRPRMSSPQARDGVLWRGRFGPAPPRDRDPHPPPPSQPLAPSSAGDEWRTAKHDDRKAAAGAALGTGRVHRASARIPPRRRDDVPPVEGAAAMRPVLLTIGNRAAAPIAPEPRRSPPAYGGIP